MQVVKEDFQIDEHSLDKEWVNQPRLYHKYAEAAADARRDMDEARNILEITKAEINKEVRTNPEKFGLKKKVTELAVAAAVSAATEVRDAEQEVIDARHRYDVLQAAVYALDHRKRALQGLVALFMANYFSTPRAPEGAKEEMEQVTERATQRRAVRRRRRGDADD